MRIILIIGSKQVCIVADGLCAEVRREDQNELPVLK